ncbi:hypothetical protein FRC08_010336 [Ceratobasidium sp. 394]|nr:hypothetical protein FRC08_010336 [Ceratobasidium sp. 394]
MRCWALYNQRCIFMALSAGLVFTVIISLVLIKVLADKAVFLPNILPPVFSGCLVLVPPDTWTLYIVPLLYDLTVFILTVRKVWSLSVEFEVTPLVQCLAKHGALHSVMLLIIVMFACIGGSNDAIKIAAHGSGILAAGLSIVCSRAIFSLHTFAEEEKRKHLPIRIANRTAGDIWLAIPMPSVGVSARAGTPARKDVIEQ